MLKVKQRYLAIHTDNMKVLDSWRQSKSRSIVHTQSPKIGGIQALEYAKVQVFLQQFVDQKQVCSYSFDVKSSTVILHYLWE